MFIGRRPGYGVEPFYYEKNAHKGSRLSSSIEFKILKQHCLILKKTNIFFLSDIYLLSFNKKK